MKKLFDKLRGNETKIDLPPVQPLTINKPWNSLNAKVDGFSTLLVQGIARQRTRLLAPLLDKLQEADLHVDQASLVTLEDYASWTLLVRGSEGDYKKLAAMGNTLEEWGRQKHEGVRIPVQKIITMAAGGRQSLRTILQDMYGIFDEQQIEVEELRTGSEGDINAVEAKLLLPSQHEQMILDIRDRLSALGLLVDLE